MFNHGCVCLILSLCFAGHLFAQDPAKIDFRRDIQPLLKQTCEGCHGPTLQMNGFRLDRRSSAMKGGTFKAIVPGNSALSMLYVRISSSDRGPQMPPTGPLKKEQIDILKTWIDQGAEWPDELAGELPPVPPDPKAVRLTDTLRSGDRLAFRTILREDPKAANLRVAGGATPLMYAALYGDLDSMRLLLESGADPNARNDAGATALMWAIDDFDKVKLLVDRGANVHAKTDIGRTPLLMAASRFGSGRVVKLLLDRGADVAAVCTSLFGPATALTEAARTGDIEVMQMLMDKGANAKAAGLVAVYWALRGDCLKCADMLLHGADAKTLTEAAMFLSVPPFGDGVATKTLLDRGADVHIKDQSGQTLLMRAANSDVLPLDTIKTLIDKGIDVNVKDSTGATALDIAKRRGNTPVVDMLVKAGAKTALGPGPEPEAKPAESPRSAVEHILPLLQRSDEIFFQKSGCVSCHNNTLTAMTVAAARKSGLRVNNDIAAKQLKTIGSFMHDWRDRVLQGIGIPGDADTISYILLGMAAEGYQADEATDAMAYFLKSQQISDGRWRILAHRPPIEASDIQVTATTMRALQLFSPKVHRAEFQKSIDLATNWLTKAVPRTTEERAFQLLSFGWSGAKKDLVTKAARGLLAHQRADGGWSQLPSLGGDAYATGQALFALKESGALAVNDAAYKRGVQFLINTQLEDGSWFVRSRAVPFQPFFESGFPHGHDQWISAAASNWAALALIPAVR